MDLGGIFVKRLCGEIDYFSCIICFVNVLCVEFVNLRD